MLVKKMITLRPQIYLKKEPFQKHIVKLMVKSVMSIMMIVWKVYDLATFFSEEDDYDCEEGYSHACDTGEEDPLISDIDGGEDY